jgi:regulator of protease activity HflC (stomatin/prohibitin superfamily)
MDLVLPIFFVLIVLLVVVGLAKTVKIVPQARAGIVERFGKYRTTLNAGLSIITPFVDRVRYTIDLREQVVSFPPQPVITEDNLVVSIDTVIYFQVTNPVAATYEIANYIQAIEQLTMTTLRNIIGGMTLEQALTSRDQINTALRGVLDEATGKWGIRVNRVELKGIDPPPSIKDSMEKQMRADRDKRAAILTRRAAPVGHPHAEGQKQSSILSAEGDREALILRAQATGRPPSCAPRVRARPSRPSSRRSTTARRPVAARLPVPADAAQDRRRRCQQGVDRPQRDRRRAQGPRLDDEQRHRHSGRERWPPHAGRRRRPGPVGQRRADRQHGAGRPRAGGRCPASPPSRRRCRPPAARSSTSP